MKSSWIRPGLAALLAAGLAACSSSTKSATMSVRLVDAPTEYSEVNLHVVEVSILSEADGWIVLGRPDVTVNLLGLTGGVSQTLVEGATIPAGRYGQLRLLLGEGNTVKLADGTTHDLVVPSGLQSGVKLTVSFDVEPGTTRDVWIDFDAHRSIWLHGAGNSDRYLLRPVVRAVDKLATGSISGVLSGDLAQGVVAPLGGVQVTAQRLVVLGGVERAEIVRTVTTSTAEASNGGYLLDLLPAGGVYFVVSQPVSGAAVFPAQASGPLAIDEATPLRTYDATFTRLGGSGAVGGSITPAAGADDADLVVARASLLAGPTAHEFIIRTAAPTLSAGSESYLLESLPPGACSVSVERRTVDALGAETLRTSAPAAATVVTGATATANLTVPALP